MPYIKQEDRPPMNEIVELMHGLKMNVHSELIYVLYKFCQGHITPSYNKYKNFLGELNEASAEIKRRLPKGIPMDVDNIPGISDPRAKELDRLINFMVEKELQVNGDLNYVLFKYTIEQDESVNRNTIVQQALGIVVKMIRGNMLAKYEDEKIEENGDV